MKLRRVRVGVGEPVPTRHVLGLLNDVSRSLGGGYPSLALYECSSYGCLIVESMRRKYKGRNSCIPSYDVFCGVQSMISTWYFIRYSDHSSAHP